MLQIRAAAGNGAAHLTRPAKPCTTLINLRAPNLRLQWMEAQHLVFLSRRKGSSSTKAGEGAEELRSCSQTAENQQPETKNSRRSRWQRLVDVMHRKAATENDLDAPVRLRRIYNFARRKGIPLNEHHVNPLVQSSVRSGDVVGVLKALQDIRKNRPDFQSAAPILQAYTSAVGFLGRRQQLGQVERIQLAMTRKGVEADVFASRAIALGLAQAGRSRTWKPKFQSAMEKLARHKVPPWTLQALELVAHLRTAVNLDGDFSPALQLMKAVQSMPDLHKHIQADSWATATAINATKHALYDIRHRNGKLKSRSNNLKYLEDYGFQYEDDDEEEGGADVENDYYIAKGQKSDEPQKAIKSFESIIEKETEPGEWGFKALKQLTKLTFRLKQYDASLSYYSRLLPYTKKAVTRNVAEKAINGILDYVSASADLDTTLMQQFYEETLKSLSETKNDRLSMKTNLKLAKLWLDRKEYARLTKILRDLQTTISAADTGDTDMTGTADNTRGTLLLEIYALEIQMYGETRNNKKLREIYDKTTMVKSAIPHPRINGVIRECGGKMHMDEKNWAKAQIDFFEAFKNYDEAGSAQRIQVLKYLVLAHMLMGSNINPFDSQETKPYKNDPQILAMTNLVDAYQNNNVHEAEKILRDNRSTIMSDPFIQEHIAEVLRSLRTQWVVEIIKPYTRIEISYLARQLNIASEDVENILIALILDKKISGRIDETTGQLELERHQHLDTRRYQALAKWTNEVQKLHSSIVAKAAQTGPAGQAGMAPGMMQFGASFDRGAFEAW